MPPVILTYPNEHIATLSFLEYTFNGFVTTANGCARSSIEPEDNAVLFSGKKTEFFHMLESQSKAAHRAAEEFCDLTKDYENLAKHIKKIEKIEHDADEITHQLANKIDATFVTPFDKEDLRSLSGALDDITDHIESAMQRFFLYRIPELRPDLSSMVVILEEISKATDEAVGVLKKKPSRKAMQPLFIHIHDLETQSDQAYRKALVDLFNMENPDPLNIIKWKEIYDKVEMTVDVCEYAANIVESMVVKYA